MTYDIPAESVVWLQHGERGSSSEAIFERLTGLPIGGGSFRGATPRDPADVRRCRLLLETVPDFAHRFDEMAGVSPQWEMTVRLWPELCATMDDECPAWRSGAGMASKTYRMMKGAGL